MMTVFGLQLARIGLALSFLGTVAVAFSFGPNPGEAYQSGGRIKGKVYLASFRYPWLFYTGLVLIAVGFLLQFIDFS